MRLRELSVIRPGKDSSIVGSYTRGLRARPTTHAVLFKLGGGCMSLIKLFFYYLVGPTIIVPGLD